jgi:hypothetical protein
MQLQAQGSSIRIIDQDGFFALLDGGWAYPLSTGVDPVEYPDAFLPYRPVEPDIEISGYEWNTTGDALAEAGSCPSRWCMGRCAIRPLSWGQAASGRAGWSSWSLAGASGRLRAAVSES